MVRFNTDQRLLKWLELFELFESLLVLGLGGFIGVTRTPLLVLRPSCLHV